MNVGLIFFLVYRPVCQSSVSVLYYNGHFLRKLVLTVCCSLSIYRIVLEVIYKCILVSESIVMKAGLVNYLIYSILVLYIPQLTTVIFAVINCKVLYY